MRMTIIPHDQIIGVDGTFLPTSFAAPANVHAIQIYENHAEVEYTDGRANEIIGTAQLPALIDQYLPVYDAARERMVASNPPAPWMIWDEQKKEFVDARSVADAVALKRAALAERRFNVETGGISVNGVTIATDRESQALLTGAWVRCQQHPDILIDWKGTNGWAQIDKATVEAIADAVGNHIQTCFTAEKAHCAALDALAATTGVTVAQIDAYDIGSGWPA